MIMSDKYIGGCQDNELRGILDKVGLSLPLAFNFHDRKRLWSVKENKEELMNAHQEICNSIDNVIRANLVINHSNYKGLKIN